ncbi:hypothetical protein [Streptomyces chrestomyceticus]|uniref:hypothetical protein n=1 Tax=Streptomyces chrestomyceticus TaxID=68185 RepID=UPI0012B6FA51|nr:hypothetical protein [Streptomyces chrestomyceticus]
MIDPTSARVPSSRPPQATSHASTRYARGAAAASAHTPASAVVPRSGARWPPPSAC